MSPSGTTHIWDRHGDHKHLARGQPEWPDPKNVLSSYPAEHDMTYHFPPKCSVIMAMNRSRLPKMAR